MCTIGVLLFCLSFRLLCVCVCGITMFLWILTAVFGFINGSHQILTWKECSDFLTTCMVTFIFSPFLVVYSTVIPWKLYFLYISELLHRSTLTLSRHENNFIDVRYFLIFCLVWMMQFHTSSTWVVCSSWCKLWTWYLESGQCNPCTLDLAPESRQCWACRGWNLVREHVV